MGDVKTPGIYPAPDLGGPVSVVEMIALAGGFNAHANQTVSVSRDGESSKVVFDDEARKERKDRFSLKNGDVIILKERYF